MSTPQLRRADRVMPEQRAREMLAARWLRSWAHWGDGGLQAPDVL
jgi:hypothetical protein